MRLRSLLAVLGLAIGGCGKAGCARPSAYAMWLRGGAYARWNTMPKTRARSRDDTGTIVHRLFFDRKARRSTARTKALREPPSSMARSRVHNAVTAVMAGRESHSCVLHPGNALSWTDRASRPTARAIHLCRMGLSPLHVAALSGDRDAWAAALSVPNVDAADDRGLTAIHLAALGGHAD